MIKYARFSNCRNYRYTLHRRWGAGNSVVQFIGLNPSTADETLDDPTLRRCIGFARDWGYDGLVMTNLFAYRSTDPRNLKKTPDPVGTDNDRYLLETADGATLVVACWGSGGELLGRNRQVLELFGKREVFCIKTTAGGHPGHPLYLPKILTPKLFAE